jgi:hypothetical protein
VEVGAEDDVAADARPAEHDGATVLRVGVALRPGSETRGGGGSTCGGVVALGRVEEFPDGPVLGEGTRRARPLPRHSWRERSVVSGASSGVSSVAGGTGLKAPPADTRRGVTAHDRVGRHGAAHDGVRAHGRGRVEQRAL